MLFNKSLALYISVLFGSKFIFKSVLLSWVGSASSSVCCASGGSSCSCSLSVWFASSRYSSSVLSSVVVSIVWVLIISSSSSKIAVVSFGGSGFKICCTRVYSPSSINSSCFKYYFIMCFCSSFVGLCGFASSAVSGSCILIYCFCFWFLYICCFWLLSIKILCFCFWFLYFCF